MECIPNPQPSDPPSTFPWMSPGEGVRLDLAQSFLQKDCVCTDKPHSSRRALSAAFPWSTGYLFPVYPNPAETFIKFRLMLSLYPLKSIFCNGLKGLAKEEVLPQAHGAALACVELHGENYPFAGQLKSSWLLC